MKHLLISLLLTTGAWAGPTKANKNLPINKDVEAVKAERAKAAAAAKTGDKAKEILKPEEDCDEKAKKEVEITPETINLGNNDAGCSLDEI